ncbi:hypothetical protein [Nioella sp. MMSF_3534]|uniref:hypothetical protein n=1 Tax=Nioella sp. MMSF_3534 TaxID=3046720 RepID=UPI00273CFD15|nr:hypothetical protein [Nioella sp. MMSF_3534]
MSDAKRIADERLAKGEISISEHSQLIAAIGSGQETPSASKSSNASASEEDPSDPIVIKRNIAKILMTIGGFGLFATTWATAETGGLNSLGETIMPLSGIALGIGIFMYLGNRRR